MSQFGGGGKPGWARPAGDSHIPAAQLPGFTGLGGVGSFGMMGVGVPMINQAAFSQPGMLGMGMMGVAQQQRPAQASATSMASSAPAAGKNRTFVGVVTKMHDSYGFVDDDVFFQHTVIRGQHPRVGEKVMVEASYNPQMPFKWNAYRIQLLSGAGAGGDSGPSHVPQARSSPAPQMSAASIQAATQAANNSRWGPSGAQERHGAPRAPSPRKRSPPRRSPRRNSPVRSFPRKRSPVPNSSSRRASPPSSRRSSPPGRKRERSPAPSTTSSLKRDSASPPRRRARIIPRYDFKNSKPVIRGDHNNVIAIRSRYNKLYVPSDFVDLTADWPDRVPVEAGIDMTNPVSFHVWHKDVDFPETENVAVLEPEDADFRHQVKVLLLAHAGKTEILKKAFGLMADGTTDDNHEVSSIFKQMQFLVGTRGKDTMAIGGSWSPSLDGADPTSPTTMIKTAIRTTKALTGIDLSGVPQWYSLVQLRYYRADKDRVDRVHLLWPDTQLLMPDVEQWEAACGQIRQQLEAKVAAVDALCVEGGPPTAAVDDVQPPVADVKDGPDELVIKEDEVCEEVATPPEKAKPKASHWNDLDVKIMKVAELKQELEARALETRGIKTLLAQRLQEALDKEQELEEDGPPEGTAVEVKKEEESEIMEVDSTPAEDGAENIAENAEPVVVVKSEEDIKKEAEEYQKKVDALEKEKKDKKASLEKHFTLPKEPKIFIFPSKTAKSGKFDCKVTSLYTLLDYRHDDNKESQFEVSIYAEAFKELIERNATFTIYQNMAVAADRDTEKKRREDAAKKEKSVEATGEKTEEEKEKEKSEKTEKVEKIDLKAVVSNRSLFEACAIFDSNLCGYFGDKDLEELILNADLGVSRGMINKLIHKLCGKNERLTYRHLTDNLLDTNGEVRYTPGTCENPPTIETLVRGFGVNYAVSETSNGEAKVSAASEDGTVVINGNVINIQQKLALLKKSEQERDSAKSALSEQNSLLAQLKDAKVDLEKKKKELEKELDKTKKKLHDTNSALKNSIDDASHLRSAVSDCRRYAERIISMADKACPPPKKEEKEKEKKSEEKLKESASGEDKTETQQSVEKMEDDGIPTGLVLSDEAGPEENESTEPQATTKEA